jgi:hypothetical protein
MGEVDQLRIINILDWKEYFVWIGSGFGTLESDRYIDMVSSCTMYNAFESARPVYAYQNNLINFLLAYNSFGEATIWSSVNIACIE